MKKIPMASLFLLLFAFETSMSVYSQGIEWDTLNTEITSLYKQGKYDRAEVVAKKALQIAEQAVGPTHPSVASSLNNLALMYDTQGCPTNQIMI